MFRVDDRSVYVHIKNASPSCNQLHTGLKLAFQSCSQTGRFGLVASRIAVCDLYVHAIPLSSVRQCILAKCLYSVNESLFEKKIN